MPLRLTNLELPIEEPEEQLRNVIIAKLGLSLGEPITWRILRKSLDARSRDSLRFVYTSTVLKPPSPGLQGSQAVAALVVIEAGKLIALQAAGALECDLG